MKKSLLLAALALLAIENGAMAQVTIDLVNIGNPGNAADTNTLGSVAYNYAIGKYDVTIGQYTAFLNAVAANDSYGLYNSYMGSNNVVGGITQNGSSGSYTYTVRSDVGGTHPSEVNLPIAYVSWFDAARFANWMANGQPTGAQSPTTTENGAYTLLGATTGVNFTKNTTNPNTGKAVNWWIPSQNEWYKAAYYDPALNSGAGGYWLYPTRSNTAPGNVIGSTPDNANINYAKNFAVPSGAPYVTDGGAFSASASAYGTYDQGGNLYQWNDQVISGLYRQERGGSFRSASASDLLSSSSTFADPTSVNDQLGFRLASVPEPATWGLLAFGFASTVIFRRRKH